MKDLDGKIAFITGASSGIGRRLAIDMAERGVRTALAARTETLLDETAAQVSKHTEALVCPCDVGVREAAEAAVRRAEAHFGRIDILVNNAGVSRFNTFLKAPVEEFEELVRVNYLGTIYCTKAVLPGMIERGSGHVVNVSSIVGRLGTARHTSYSPTKFAMTGFTESLWYELRGTGVGITVVNPGLFATRLFDDPSFRDVPESARSMMKDPALVSRATIEAIRKDRFEITVPSILGIPILIKALFPGLFRWLQARHLRRSR